MLNFSGVIRIYIEKKFKIITFNFSHYGNIADEKEITILCKRWNANVANIFNRIKLQGLLL